MNTTRLQENISALTDGELPACDVELTMAALADPQGQAAWDAYRLIGDVLRADAGAVEPAPGFAARLAARLAAEPWPDDGGEPGVADDDPAIAASAPDADAGADVGNASVTGDFESANGATRVATHNAAAPAAPAPLPPPADGAALVP